MEDEELTPNAISRLLTESMYQAGGNTFCPVVQVLDFKLVKYNNRERYIFIISDGVMSLPILVGGRYLKDVKRGSVRRGSIIHIGIHTRGCADMPNILVALSFWPLVYKHDIIGNNIISASDANSAPLLAAMNSTRSIQVDSEVQIDEKPRLSPEPCKRARAQDEESSKTKRLRVMPKLELEVSIKQRQSNSVAPIDVVNEDLVGSGKVTVSHPEGANQPPSIFIDKSLINSLASEWKHSVVIKLLGKVVPFSVLEKKIKELWPRPTRVLDLHNNYLLVRFNTQADFNYALNNGPWLITDHYLVVKKWDPGFDARTEQIKLIRAWVLIKGLPVFMHQKQVLFAIVSAIGKPIKLDEMKPPSGQFARVCLEFDISVPLKTEMSVNGQRIEVEYEGLDVCCNCGRYGHHLNQCRSSIQKNSD